MKKLPIEGCNQIDLVKRTPYGIVYDLTQLIHVAQYMTPPFSYLLFLFHNLEQYHLELQY